MILLEMSKNYKTQLVFIEKNHRGLQRFFRYSFIRTVWIALETRCIHWLQISVLQSKSVALDIVIRKWTNESAGILFMFYLFKRSKCISLTISSVVRVF